MAVGAIDNADCVVLGPAEVDGAAVATLLNVLKGTKVPSRKQFLVADQLM